MKSEQTLGEAIGSTDNKNLRIILALEHKRTTDTFWTHHYYKTHDQIVDKHHIDVCDYLVIFNRKITERRWLSQYEKQARSGTCSMKLKKRCSKSYKHSSVQSKTWCRV